jgi:hypothetical protein
MTTVVLIASARPELAVIARASITRFYATRDVTVKLIQTPGLSSTEHAAAFESQRGVDADQVIMFDDDAMVISPKWLATLQDYHAMGYETVGGIRSRGHVEQIIVDGQLIPHPSCLSWTRKAWQNAAPFAAVPEPGVPFLRYDTAVLATLRAGPTKTLPFRPLHGREHTHFGPQITEYYDPARPSETLWAHLMRGTAFAPRSRVREMVRSVTALWSPRSQKIQRRQDLRAEYIARACEILEWE